MSTHTTPIALDFNKGIDRETLDRLRDRFLEINRQRWQRAHSALAGRQQVVLEILPLVFHTNHPALPGYLGADCPCGVSHYRPDAAAVSAAQRLTRTFKACGEDRHRADLEALFLMGSPGTLGHSMTSDLDVWLCHRDDLQLPEVQLLERKAQKLSEWALSFGLELHVFVFSATDWRAGRQRIEVTGENCDGAQHYLLLDEFYRTGIHLGGRYPLWWLIPSEQESRYRECVDILTESRLICAEDYIDFGAVPKVPVWEFLGAGVWQLDKGIDAPWKSILKLLLIECYAQSQDQPVLSRVFKQSVFSGVTDVDRLDPYVMLYRRLEQWLTGAGATARLDLVRRSLYIKAGLPLTREDEADDHASGHWRTRLLANLVADWDWPQTRLETLDSRQRWYAEEVSSLRAVVVSELTHSYRMLSKMVRDHGEHTAISANDINVLGRKLYAAFQRKAGKVEQINPGLVPSLAEQNLTFYNRSESGVPTGNWLLYRDPAGFEEASSQSVIQRSGNLAELIVWCYYNGLLTRTTQLDIHAGQSAASVDELREMLGALTAFLPFPVALAERQALACGVRPLRNLLLLNVGVDPQTRFSGQDLHKPDSPHDSPEPGGGSENLVHTIDQVTFNSWHEISLQHYASGDTLIQCLKNVLASAALAPRSLPSVEVHSYKRGHGGAIAERVQTLFDDVLLCFFAGGAGPRPLRYVIEMGDRYFLVEFSGSEPGFIALESRKALMECLAQPRETYIPVVFDRHALRDEPELRAICDASEPDNLQVFYLVRAERALIRVIDERGSVFGWEQPVSNPRYLLTPLLRFLENLVERRTLRFSEIPVALAEVRCYEMCKSDGGWHPEYRPQPRPGIPLPGLEVQAVGVQEGDRQLRFDLFCGGREFTVLQYGDQLIPTVAHYIHSLRQSGERYPVYLTDLHLPHDLDPQVYQQDIQTSQYLYYRSLLEDALNHELATVI